MPGNGCHLFRNPLDRTSEVLGMGKTRLMFDLLGKEAPGASQEKNSTPEKDSLDCKTEREKKI